MKKFYILAIALATGISSASAFNVERMVNFGLCNFSPDGNWAIGYQYEVTSILNRSTNKKYVYDDSELIFGIGHGNFISDTGLLAGTHMNDYAAWWQNGEWHSFPDINGKESYASAVTPDGSRIVGWVQPDDYTGDFEGMLYGPCYWDVNPDGTVSETKNLPYPEVDLTGRTPMSVSAICISADGKTIGGQVRDYAGNFMQPIVFTENADGDWTYTLIQDEIFHPEGIVFPEWPGEVPDTNPIYFMDDDARAAYQWAYNNWMDSGFDPELWPDPKDYMTDEEYAAWKEAENDADEKYNKFLAFDAVYQELYRIVPSFDFNNAFLTPDARYYITSNVKITSTTIGEPYVFDLNNNTFKKYSVPGVELIVSAVTDDCTILAQKAASMSFPYRIAYILPAGADNFVLLENYLKESNPELADWMKSNFLPIVDPANPKEEILVTGIPFCASSLDVFGVMIENLWNSEGEDFSFIFSDTTLGVKAADMDNQSISINALPGGVLKFEGAVGNAEVYDLQGRKVLSLDNPDTVETGLNSGVYIVKADNGKKTITSKVIF